MNKKLTILCALPALLVPTSCANPATTIRICASQLPHAKILQEVVAPIVQEKGYTLNVKVLDWTIQNSVLAAKEYDANYFQHIPYLETYTGSVSLLPACKVHYEKLCVYKGNDNNGIIENGESIVLVNDVSNIERALKLLQSYNILTINDSCYESGSFDFDIRYPYESITLLDDYKDCSLEFIKESQLCIALPDYNFGIIPGNTALTGLGDDASRRIVLAEQVDEETISLNANVIAIREEDKNSEKIKILVEALGDYRVKEYIENTFGGSVLYHYEKLI